MPVRFPPPYVGGYERGSREGAPVASPNMVTLNRRGVAQPSTAASLGGVSPPGPSSSETLGELAGGTLALQGGSWVAALDF